MTTLFKYVQAQNFSLAGSGASAGATSITLKSFTGIDGALLTMSDFGSMGFATIEPGNGTQEEQISFTGVVQNANGTATLTGVSTVLFINPYTATSGLAKTHAGSTTLIISNTAGFYDQFPAKNNDETINGAWRFTGQVTFDLAPISPITNPLASDTVYGISKLSVAAANVLDPIVVGTNDPRVPVAYAVDAVGTDAYAITPSPAITAYVAGQRITFKAGTANTGPATLAVNGLTAKAIVKNVSQPLLTGDILANQILTVVYDGTNFQLLSPFPSQVVLTYNFSDSPATWTKQTGLKFIMIEMWGGGGGGGRKDGTDAGGGGGGGAYAWARIEASLLGATETVTIGAGGAARSTNGVGNIGTLSSFGSWLTAYPGAGGAGTVSGNGGGGGGGALSTGVAGSGTGGGNGGQPEAATYGAGGAAEVAGVVNQLGGGGGGGGSNGATAAIGGASVEGGGGGGGGGAGALPGFAGGASIHGGGGGGGASGSGTPGAGGDSKLGGDGSAGVASGGTASAGAVPGGGGGGSGSGGTSGAGGNGKVIITEYY